MEKQQIQQYLGSLKQRGRRFSLLVLFIATISLALFTLLLISLGLSFHLDYSVTIALSGIILLGIFGFRLKQFLAYWKQFRSQEQMAHLVERRLPSLRGRTFLAMEDADEHFLLLRAFHSVWTAVSEFPKDYFVSSQPVLRGLKQFSYAVILILIAQFTLPIGPFQSLLSLEGKADYRQQRALTTEIDPDVKVIIGDISILYTFPDYTKMSSVEIPNSDGHVQAPAGTLVQIKARTLRSYQAASIQFNDETIEPVDLTFGRDIDASFVLSEEGTYRFLLLNGEKQLASGHFEMDFHDDNPPIVTAELERNKIPANRPIKIKWNALDDFGLERVIIEIEKDDETKQIVLKKPKNNILELSSTLKRVAKQLGLRGGDEVILRIVAYDNQAPVDQSENIDLTKAYGKRGASADMKLTILTPEMSAKEMRELNRKLRDAMIPALAAYLMESSLPSYSPRGMMKWSEKAKLRYKPLRELVDSEWGEQWPTYLSAKLIREVQQDSGTMLRYVSTTYGEGRVGEPKAQDNKNFSEMHVAHVAQLERAVFLIDRMLRQVVFQEVSRQSKKLSSAIERLVNKDLEEMDASEIFAQLDPVDRAMYQLKEEAEELSESALKEFIQNRISEIDALKEEMKKAAEAKDMEQTRSLMEQVSSAIDQFSEGVEEQLERMKQEEDELQQEMESLIEKLEQIEKKQQGLAKEIQLAREQEPEEIKQMVAIWDKIFTLATQAEKESKKLLNLAGDGSGFRSNSLQRYDRLAEDQTNLLQAAKTKYLSASIEALKMVIRRVATVQYINDMEMNRARYGSDTRPTKMLEIERTTTKITQLNSDVEKLLVSLLQNPVSETIEMQELAKQLSSDEQDLYNEMKQTESKVQEVEQQMPTADGSAFRFAQEATESMDVAEDNLAKGQAMQGEGFQVLASLRVRDTIEALQDEMKQMQQMQQQVSQMSGKPGEGNKPGENGEDDSEEMANADIPLDNDKLSPEEYRRALLEGMKGNVPQEFEALKKRYYEELVAQ